MLVSNVAAACIHPLRCSNLFDIMFVFLSNSHTLQTQLDGLVQHDARLAARCAVDEECRAEQQEQYLRRGLFAQLLTQKITLSVCTVA